MDNAQKGVVEHGDTRPVRTPLSPTCILSTPSTAWRDLAQSGGGLLGFVKAPDPSHSHGCAGDQTPSVRRKRHLSHLSLCFWVLQDDVGGCVEVPHADVESEGWRDRTMVRRPGYHSEPLARITSLETADPVKSGRDTAERDVDCVGR
eukprot:3198552-Rhodomonas_salina.3